MPWQRLLSLQVLRSLMADQQLLYVLFTSYDMSIHHDMNAVHDTLTVAVDTIKVRLWLGVLVPFLLYPCVCCSERVLLMCCRQMFRKAVQSCTSHHAFKVSR